MESSEDVSTAGQERTAGRSRGTHRGRALLGLVSAAALLMLGASVGMLINAPSEQRADPEPSPVDIGFAQDMSADEHQAVAMAALAGERSRDPAVRVLAREVEVKQRDQIGRMQGWLSLWGEPPESPNPPLSWMTAGVAPDQRPGGPSAQTSPGMPGAAGPGDIARLRGLRGARFDTEFLQLMLRQLEGSTTIARYGSEHGSQSPVQELGSTMLDQQSSQVQQIQHLLGRRRPPR